MSELPDLLPYHNMLAYDKCPEIKDIFCYIVKEYMPGIAVVIKLQDKDVVFIVGDWDGNRVGPKDNIWAQSQDFLAHTAYKFAKIMEHIGLGQAQYFIDSGGALVDAQLSLNKFMGPGMLRDLFNSAIKTQEVESMAVINADKAKELRKLGARILKPSRYRFYVRDDKVLPLYARI